MKGSASQLIVPAPLQKLVVMVGILFAWHQSNFQFDLYWTSSEFASFVYLVMVAAAFIGALSSLGQRPSHPLYFLIMKYILICTVFGLLTLSPGSAARVDPLFFLKAIVFALFMLWIISDKGLLSLVLRTNCFLGLILFVLNSVTVFHWLDWLTLSNIIVDRVGGNPDEHFLNPLHFGIFGLTENFEYPLLGLARLQGFSSEPLHWGYFVMLSASSGFALLALSSSYRERVLLRFSIIFMAIYSIFLQSSTLYLSIIAVGLTMLLYAAVRLDYCERRKRLGWMFFVLVLFPGVILPFTLVQVPDISSLFLAEEVLNKGSNWSDKIDYLALGSDLYTILIPNSWSAVSASHNVVLEKYIDGGYLFLLLLLNFFYLYLKKTVALPSITFACAISLCIIGNTLTGPAALMYPSGALWLFSLAGVVRFAKFRCLDAVQSKP